MCFQVRPIASGAAQVVYGARFAGRLTGNRILLHDIGNKILTGALNALFGANLTDIETGYKIIPRKFFGQTPLRCEGFDIEPEITARLLRGGYRISEIPISYNARGFDEGKKIRLIDGFAALFTIVRCRFF